MFPGYGAQVYYNAEGEPLGWDYLAEPEYDPDDYLPTGEDEVEYADEEDND